MDTNLVSTANVQTIYNRCKGGREICGIESKITFGKATFRAKVAFGKVILAEGRGEGRLELGDEVVQVAASVVGDVALGVKLYAPERQVAMP